MRPRLSPAARLRWPALLLLVAPGLSGCTTLYDPCFASQQHVKDLRILAVRADPPEVVFEPGSAELPSVQLTALFADPGSTGDVAISALLCPQTEDRHCPEGTPEAAAIAGAPDKLSVTVRPTAAQLQAALAADPLNGFGGIRMQVELVARASFNRVLSATKLLLFTPASPGYVPNHGLEISGLYVTRRGLPIPVATLLKEGDQLELAVGEYLGVRPLLNPGGGATQAAEDYETVDLRGNRVRLREQISYSLYSTAHAAFEADSALEPPPDTLVGFDGLFRFRPTFAANGNFYVVARDGRGGEAWLTAQWHSIELRVGTRLDNLELGCDQ